ncbi:MAG: hypothetical protein V7782_13805 [Psychromonas sp.]
MPNKVNNINFWNGNKSSARQYFESELLQAVLTTTENANNVCELNIDNTDYPDAQDEGNIFANGTDILVTVAGNLKFIDKPKIMIEQPLCKGLLGYRLLLVNDKDRETFLNIQNGAELQSLSIGIPATWVDAELFRENQYKVVEKGIFDDLFTLLVNAEFDYCALGVNEIEKEFEERVKPVGDISIEPSLMLYYPFPLVFYVNPDNKALAERVHLGLADIFSNGIYENIFQKHYGDIVTRLNLKQRKVFTLDNAILPNSMKNFRSTLLD